MEGRDQLKKKFKAANIGYESYRALIDSVVNKKDDGIDKNEEDGLKLSVLGTSQKLLSFYPDKTANNAEWFVKLNPNNQKGLDISNRLTNGSSLFMTVVTENIDNKKEKRVRLGVGTSRPQYTLDVEGTVSMHARVGNFKKGTIPADKRWHTILDESEGLDSCQAYEIIAHINDTDQRRYSLTHAIILISDGPRGETIRATSKYLWGKFLNRIKFRRKFENGRYVIQCKARDHHGYKAGRTKKIYYRITKLWDKDFENDNYIETRRVKKSAVTGKKDPSSLKRIKRKK